MWHGENWLMHWMISKNHRYISTIKHLRVLTKFAQKHGEWSCFQWLDCLEKVVFTLNKRFYHFIVYFFGFGIAYRFSIQPFYTNTQGEIGSFYTLGKFLSREVFFLR